MAAKAWDLTTPAVDALNNTIPGHIRDVKEHAQIGVGFYAEDQDTPDQTIAIYEGVVYFGITKVEYAGLAVADLGTAGAFETTALTADFYNKILFTIDSSGTLAIVEGTENVAAGGVGEPAVPIDKFPICMVTIQDDGNAGAGTILTIEQSEITQLQGFAHIPSDKAESGANADITSMTGLDDNGIPLAKVTDAASDGANADITSMTGLDDNGIPLAKVTDAASDGANADITSMTGLTTPLAEAYGGSGTTGDSIIKAFVNANASGGINDSYNVDTVNDTAIGKLEVVWDTNFGGGVAVLVGIPQGGTGSIKSIVCTAQAATDADFECGANTVLSDPTAWLIMAIGDQ